MADGFFLGGVASGIESGRANQARTRGLDLEERGLDLRERAMEQDFDLRSQGLAIQRSGLGLRERALSLQQKTLENELSRQKTTLFDERINSTMKVISDTMEAATAVGVPGEESLARVEPLLQQVDAMAAAIGRDPTLFREQAASYAARPSAEDLAASAGRAEAQQTLAQRQTIASELGEDVAGAATGLTVGDFEGNTYMMPSGKFETVPRNDPAANRRAIARGGTLTTGFSVQAPTTEGLSPTTSGPTTDNALGQLIEDTGEAAERLRQLEIAAQAAVENPDATGLIGAVAQAGAGLVNQVTDAMGTERAFDTERVQRVRTRLRFLASEMLQPITQEDNRYTEDDVKRAQKAIAVLEPTADLGTILGAIQTASEIVGARTMADIQQIANAEGLNIRELRQSEEARAKLVEVLVNNNFTISQAADFVVRLVNRAGQ